MRIFVFRDNQILCFAVLKNMNFEQLNFTMFCVGNVADALKMSAGNVYRLLRDSGILMEYIVSYMKEKGVLQ